MTPKPELKPEPAQREKRAPVKPLKTPKALKSRGLLASPTSKDDGKGYDLIPSPEGLGTGHVWVGETKIPVKDVWLDQGELVTLQDVLHLPDGVS